MCSKIAQALDVPSVHLKLTCQKSLHLPLKSWSNALQDVAKTDCVQDRILLGAFPSQECLLWHTTDLKQPCRMLLGSIGFPFRFASAESGVCCSKPAQGKQQANARKKPRPQPISSGSIPSTTSDLDEDDAAEDTSDHEDPPEPDTDHRNTLRVTKTAKPDRPGDRAKGRRKAVSRVDKENTTPEIARRAAPSPVAVKPGRYACCSRRSVCHKLA